MFTITSWHEARQFQKDLIFLIRQFRIKGINMSSLIQEFCLKWRGKKVGFPEALDRHYFSQIFRHWHIAMSELRGKTREQIEIPASNNMPNQDEIDKIKTVLLKSKEEGSHA